MIVCHCAGVTDSDITRLIRQGVSSVREIARQSGAGRCCAPCREEIAALIVQEGGSVRQERLIPPDNALIPVLAD